MKYSIFDRIIESSVSLPELQKNSHGSPSLFFRSYPITKAPKVRINWCHHWRLPDGRISISVGKENAQYWIRFPRLVDFHLNTQADLIIAYQHKDTPDYTVSHLLLDQVLPRFLSHKENCVIIHASSIQIGDTAIAFCGQSGWGKSTLAAYFYSLGHSLLTDDCLLLKGTGSSITGLPNYHGIRLYNDSLSLLSQAQRESKPVCHYASKRRVTLPGKKLIPQVPISTIFFLNDPKQELKKSHISSRPISKSLAIIELIKNCFSLDITAPGYSTNQLVNLASLTKNSNTKFCYLHYVRDLSALKDIVSVVTKPSCEDSGD